MLETLAGTSSPLQSTQRTDVASISDARALLRVGLRKITMPAQDWQPIDTAPNDIEILVYTHQWGPIIARHSEEHGEWMSRMQVPVSLSSGEDFPTHWQALPEPPEGVEATDERNPKSNQATAATTAATT